MPKKKSDSKINDKLNFEEAKDMTIEEAVRKEAEIKAGITENDSILDKYIKQNREEIASQKFENTRELSNLGKSQLDDFISEQRKALEDSKALDKEVAASNATASKPDVKVSNTIPLRQMDFDDIADERTSDDSIGIGLEEPAQAFYKKKGFWFASLAAVILAGSAVGYGLLRSNQANNASETSTQTTETTETREDTAAKDKESLATFNQRYAAFFVDEEQTKLKNSEFDKLSELEALLTALEGSSYYDEIKTKYDRLSKSIAAVQAVNAKFESPAIVDGEKVATNLKADSTLDDLSATALNTGNATLDTLLQAVVAEARSDSGVSGGNSGAELSTATAVSDKAQVKTEASRPASVESAAKIYGITNYDLNSLQRHLSRVPYNFDLIADEKNTAWTFNEGILEKIVATSQERGYITGNDYILEKVNIINGNGYYNMFKPDGTYLFSINCKTGYFVGNAKGNADSLDY